MIRYLIPLGGIKKSTNEIYAGKHWRARQEYKDAILSYARGFCRPVKVIGSYPVEISYRFFFSSRALDSLNCAYMAKVFEDAFRAFGILKDDTPAYVAASRLASIAVHGPEQKAQVDAFRKEANAKDGDWLEVIITEPEARESIH